MSVADMPLSESPGRIEFAEDMASIPAIVPVFELDVDCGVVIADDSAAVGPCTEDGCVFTEVGVWVSDRAGAVEAFAWMAERPVEWHMLPFPDPCGIGGERVSEPAFKERGVSWVTDARLDLDGESAWVVPVVAVPGDHELAGGGLFAQVTEMS